MSSKRLRNIQCCRFAILEIHNILEKFAYLLMSAFYQNIRTVHDLQSRTIRDNDLRF